MVRRTPSLLVRLGAALFLLALWAQAAAPLAGAHRDDGGAALRAVDPFLHPVICGRPAEPSTQTGEPGQGPACAACPLCCCGAAAPVPPAIVPFARRLRWIAVAWPIPPPARTRPTPRRSVRARAPPLSS